MSYLRALVLGGLYLTIPNLCWGTITALNPPATTAGGPAFLLSASCSGCDGTDEITWNGNILPRCGVAPCFTLVNAGLMTVMVPASFIAAPGVAVVGLRDFNSLNFIINARPMIVTTSPLANGVVGAAYTAPLAATGGTAPLQWSLPGGALPLGLTLDARTGVISGTTAASGLSSFTVAVTDSTSATDIRTFQLTINAAGLVITTATPLPAGNVGVGYQLTFAASSPPYQWSITAGTPPPGMTLNQGTGGFTGTPTTAGVYTFTVSADIVGQSATKVFTMNVNATVPAIERVIVSQVADGAGEWKATITISNNSAVLPASVQIRFYAGDGSPLGVLIVNESRVSRLVKEIPPGGSIVLDSAATDPTLTQGWLEVISSGGGGGNIPSVSTFVRYRQRLAGRQNDAEATAGGSRSDASEILVPYDNTGGFVTSLALVNSTTTAGVVVATFRGQGGAILHQEAFPIAALGQVAFATNTRFPASANTRGVVVFSSPNARIAPLVFLFSPTNSFISVPFTVID